jgi:hypothetical protein
VEGGWLGSFSWSVCKEKREETREEEEKGHLAEIHLNFEKNSNLVQEVVVFCQEVIY